MLLFDREFHAFLLAELRPSSASFALKWRCSLYASWAFHMSSSGSCSSNGFTVLCSSIYIYICIYNICIYNISTTFPISCKILRNCDSTITYGQHVFGSYKSYELQKLWPDQSRSPAGSCSWPCLARTASSCFSMLSAP